jgi:hypothetical protein
MHCYNDLKLVRLLHITPNMSNIINTNNTNINMNNTNTCNDYLIVPLHILIHIAKLDIPTYKCMLSIPNVARYFKNQQHIQKHFTIINKDGESILNGKLHSIDDKPAYIRADGTQYWYQHGKLHRDNDKPAIIRADGTQRWFQHGKLHRDN